jgi:tetratricopeptide (TPR) repeat protein
MQQISRRQRSEWKFLGSSVGLALALGSLPAFAEPPDEVFARSKEHFNAGRLQEAAAGFRSLALTRPPIPIGESAALLYLDASARLLLEGKGANVANEMTGTAAELLDLHCPAKRAAASSTLCETLPTIHGDLLRLQAEARSKVADKGGPDAAIAARESANLYFSIWTLYGDAAKKGRAPYRRMDEVLYNVGVMYQVAGMAPESIRIFRLLTDPDKGMRTSPLAAQAFRRLSGIFMSIGEYAEGASWLERFARERPTEGAAPDALRDAVVLRLALGQAREAEVTADLFSKLYGSKKPADAAEIAFAIGAWYADRGDFKAAQQRLKASLPMISKSAPLAVHIQARAALARSLAATGDARGAEEHFRAVQMIFKDPHAVLERIRMQGPDLSERRLGQGLTALGEAHFFFAEREREKASSIKLPAYRGPADRDALKKNLPEALRARRRAMEQAEAAYIRILSIEPLPPPKWVVEAAAQVAWIWADLVNDLRAIAGSIKKEGAGQKAALADIEGAIEPFFKSALAAAKTCEMYSIKYQYSSEASRRCQAWLTENTPRAHPKIEELAPRIGHIRQGATELEVPLLRPGDAAPRP